MEYRPKDIAGKLAQSFLDSPITLVLGIAILTIGTLALLITPREEDPQIKVAGGSVIVAMPGATAPEVKNIIVEPLERKLREIKEIQHIYGMAMDDVGIVNVRFYIGEEKEESNLKVYDKIMQNMDLLPAKAMQPLIKPLDIDTAVPILSFAFYAKNPEISQVELTKKTYEIQHKINALQDVAVTELRGGRIDQYNVEVDLGKLSGYNLSLGQIAQAIQALAVNLPDIKEETHDGKLVVFGIKNAIENVEDLQNVIVASYMGSAIYLRDVAVVTRGFDFQNKQEAWVLDKHTDEPVLQPQVTLTVSKLQGTNAVFVAERVLEALDSYRAELDQAGIQVITTRNYGQRADEAVNDLVFHLQISIVIIAILLVFALGTREAIIVTLTVPAIFSINLFIAYLTGQTINRITLFAFLMSLGLLVDAAIIVIENIHRHLHAHDAKGKSLGRILVEATDEIGAPTNVATLAIILTMVPMYFVGDMMGQFMKPIPSNVPVALLASLVVAYIFTPYLARRMYRKYESHDAAPIRDIVQELEGEKR